MSILSKYKTNLNRKKKKNNGRKQNSNKKKSYNHIYTIYTNIYTNFTFFAIAIFNLLHVFQAMWVLRHPKAKILFPKNWRGK